MYVNENKSEKNITRSIKKVKTILSGFSIATGLKKILWSVKVKVEKNECIWIWNGISIKWSN